jgi:hypothetical protein
MCDVLNYIGEHLAGPVLAALIGGPLLAVVFRWTGRRREVGENDARVIELDEDLRRWVTDRERVLQQELIDMSFQIAKEVNESTSPITVEQVPAEFRRRMIEGMQIALQQYRDQATRTVREFSALARSESWLLARYRRRRQKRRDIDLPVLKLDKGRRGILGRWRKRTGMQVVGKPEPAEVAVSDDPTAGEESIAPLETDEGLTWAAAAERSTL